MTIDSATLEANRKCPYGGGCSDCPCEGKCFYKQFAKLIADMPLPILYVDGVPTTSTYAIHRVLADDLPDWDKPPGCHCNTIARARGCENRCDDWLTDKQQSSIMTTRRGARDMIIAGALAIIASLALWAFADILPHAATGCVRMADAMPLFGDCNAPR